MISKRWFTGLAGAMLYVTGMNDEALHHVGNWWLALPRWLHVVIVVALLALAAWVTVRILAARRRAYQAAVLAAALLAAACGSSSDTADSAGIEPEPEQTAAISTTTAASTEPAAADGGTPDAAPEPVTELVEGAEPLKVTFIVTDVSAVASALGWEVPDDGDLEAAIATLVDHANANGGVGGHPIEAAVRVFNAITDSPISEEQLCNAITQDDDADVVVLTGQFQDNARPCYAAAGALMLDVTLFPIDHSGYEAHAPLLWSPLLPDYGQLVGGLSDALAAAGWLQGATVGVVGIDNDMNRRINEQVLTPRLAESGVTAAATNWIDPADGTTFDTGLRQTILDFKSADVDKVIALGGSRLIPWLIDVGAAQNFAPAYALTSYDSPEFNIRNYADLMHGSMGITVLPGWDVADDQYPSPANDAEALCLQVLASGGHSYETRANSRGALLYCDAVRLLQHAGAHAASLSADDLATAMWALGDEFSSASVYSVAFTEGSYTGSSGYRVFAFDDSCSCMVILGETVPFSE